MSHVNILKFGVSSPADTSPLQELRKAGYHPSQVIAIIGKCEGNGCVNDFSRTLNATVWEPLLPSDAVTIFSGGTEGVLSPHVTFLVRENKPTGLIAAVGRTRKLEPYEIGTGAQGKELARVVLDLKANINAINQINEIHMVLVKCPLLTSTKIQAIREQFREPAATDTYSSMAKSRYVSAICTSEAILESTIDEEEAETWSNVASCSCGAEIEDCHILVLADASRTPPGTLRAASTTIDDAIDARELQLLFNMVKNEGGRVVQVFAKADADPSREIRGKRHTMNTDSDLHSTRHARAAVGCLIAGLTGDTQVYVSGGAEGQGRPGGGNVCVVYSVPRIDE